MKERINKLCKKYNLGCPTEEPVMITGGLLHKMYRVETDQGKYAIKVLNPDIMQRPAALQNMIHSELVSNELKDIVPLVAARSFQNQHVLKEDGQFFMVFDWLEGKSVFVPEISEYHCEQIGRMLGKIHAANIKISTMEEAPESRNVYDWGRLLEAAHGQDAEGYQILKDNLQKIMQWDEDVVANQPEISKVRVISHRDLDPKNVMWKDERAYIIDWEAAGYVNPYQELVEVLNYWIVDAEGKYDDGKFQALTKAYTESMDINCVNWEAVLKCSFDGMLGWLEYNVKRMCGLEGSKEEDRQEGSTQVVGTIGELKRYEEQIAVLRQWIDEKLMNEIILVKPTMEYADQIMQMKQELLEAKDNDAFAGCCWLEDYQSIEEWITHLNSRENPETCPEGGVPSNVYLAVRTSDNKVIGIIDLRHHIDHPVLGLWGGHMGYSVRPDERGKGYAKEMLRLNLQNCRDRGLEKVMVTCHPWNTASEKTILANGGVFEKTVDADGEQIKRYWITL